MSDERAPAGDPSPEVPRCPECDTPMHLRERLHSVAARLRGAATTLGGEVMVEIPSRLGDHEGLLLALANELEQLVE
jgi:hypothetical protein